MIDTRHDQLSRRPWTRLRVALVLALAVGALGIALLWAGGVPFPIAVPPGLLILAVAALLAALFRVRWTSALGVLVGLFILGGFLTSGTGYSIIAGEAGTIAQIGQIIEVMGAAASAVVGVALAVRGG